MKVKTDLRPMKKLQRELKSVVTKAIKPISKEVKKRVKDAAPKLTGALKSSVWEKVVVKGFRCTAVIGPRSKYEKHGKIPNLYAGKEDKLTGFISDSVTDADLVVMAAAAKKAIADVLGG